jgi:hypothetical protein
MTGENPPRDDISINNFWETDKVRPLMREKGRDRIYNAMRRRRGGGGGEEEEEKGPKGILPM